MQLLKETAAISDQRLTYKNKLEAYLTGKNDVPINDVITAIKTQYPNIDPGDIHQAFVDAGYELTPDSVELLNK
ncbi:MAG: hypothetical protein OEW37_07770 [Rhodospirillaceae bacterium]|nr:hypothetical protein [Rhodospirillaceae bacterium]